MKLWFEDRFERRRLVAEVDTEEEARKKIYVFLKKFNYTSPYMRTWKESGEMWFDVGSHSEFFVMTEDQDG